MRWLVPGVQDWGCHQKDKGTVRELELSTPPSSLWGEERGWRLRYWLIANDLIMSMSLGLHRNSKQWSAESVCVGEHIHLLGRWYILPYVAKREAPVSGTLPDLAPCACLSHYSFRVLCNILYNKLIHVSKCSLNSVSHCSKVSNPSGIQWFQAGVQNSTLNSLIMFFLIHWGVPRRNRYLPSQCLAKPEE